MQDKIQVNIEQDKIGIKEYMEDIGYSARQTKKLLKEKKILLNGRTAYWDNVLKPGDCLQINLKENKNQSIAPEAITIDILYEDEHLLAVNKPPYMVVHPTKNTVGGTLANAVAYYFEQKNINAPVRLLNRLDMNTSGIIIVPKSAMAHSRLSMQMEQEQFKKEYVAVVEGHVQPTAGFIERPIGRSKENPLKQQVTEAGLYAATSYQSEKTLRNATLLRLQLHTGRTHQIRVHLCSLGFPIIGDTLYGTESPLIERQALHAASLTFRHPKTDLLLELTAPMPEDMLKLIKQLTR